MVRIVFKPVKAPVVDHEGLYSARFNGREFFKVRARNAAHAEEKVMFLMARETMGKVIDYNLEQFRKEKDNGNQQGDGGLVPPGREAPRDERDAGDAPGAAGRDPRR